MASFIFIDKDRVTAPKSTKVIKAADYSRIVSADKLLSEARINADKIIAQARKKAEEIIKAAEIDYETEKQKGYHDGIQTAKQEMADRISTLAIKTSQYYSNLEENITTLVMNTVRKVIGGIDKNELISGLVKSALAVMKSQKQITLKVAPVQVDSLNERISEIIQNYPQINSIEVQGDGRLSPGQLVIESPIGIVDAGIETQLTSIEAAFKRCFQPENTI